MWVQHTSAVSIAPRLCGFGALEVFVAAVLPSSNAQILHQIGVLCFRR